MKVDNLPDVDENTIQAQIDGLEREKAKIKKKLNKAFDDYEDGVYSANEFVERKAKHNQKLESIQKQIEELENSIPEKDEYEEMILMLSDTLSAILDETLDADVKNAYLKQVLDRIEFSRENDEEFILDVMLK
jgi:DNA repair ATPase RecN